MLQMLSDVEVPPFVVLLGALVGLSYGVLGLGLVLVYRLHRVLNLSQVATGAFGAAVGYTLWNSLGAPFWLALVGGAVASAAVGALVYAVVVRRLDGAPAALTMVATLGVAQLLTTFTTSLTGEDTTRLLPGRGETVVRSGLPQFEVGPLLVSSGHVGMVLSGVVCTATLAYVLRATRIGRSIRAAADNGDAALLAGMPVRLLGAAAWGMAAGATTLMLTFATEAGYGRSSASGAGGALPLSLTLMSFAAACCAGMSSLIGAVVAGVALGVVSQVLRWNLGPSTPWVDVVLFVIVLVALLLVRRLRGRPGEGAGWVRAEIWAPVPHALGRLPLLRLGGPVASGLLIALVAATVLVWPTNSTAVTRIAAAALVAFGVCVLCGLAGEVSLGQLAIAGTGGVGSFVVVQRTGNFALAVVVAVIVGAVVGVLLGLPSLRLRGTALALTTLSFAVALPEMLFRPGGVLAGAPDPGQPVVGTFQVSLGPPFALFSLALFTAGLVVVYASSRGPLHRLVCAVRDNELGAAAFGIRIQRLRLWALAVSGGVSALGGVVMLHGSPGVTADLLPAGTSILILLGAVLGGMTSLLGAVLGVVLAVGAPLLLPGSSLATQGTALFALLVLLLYPGGAVSVLRGLRERAVALALRVHGVEVASALAPAADGVGGPEAGARSDIPASLRPGGGAPVVTGHPAETVLSACGLGRRFGGTVAVDCVDLHLHHGEIVALVGPNGAGKTTTFELISGFTRPDHGIVELRGEDVTDWSPQRRARAGLVRSFQNGQMFPSLTVEQCIAVALERSHPTSIALGMLGRETGRGRWEVVDDVVAYFGLEGYRSTRLGELSTGTRRIVEIASVVASRPQAVLLDEPSAGIAESECAALAEELRRWRDELGLSILIIEHDLNLVSAVADRVVVMAEGRVISEGPPDQVWDDPAVLEGYVGTRHGRAGGEPGSGDPHADEGPEHAPATDALTVDVGVRIRPATRGGRPR